MIVLYLYAHFHAPIAQNLLTYWPDAKLHYVATDDYDTWETIKQYWGQDDLVLVEQHKILHDQVMPEFLKCPEPWCVFPHELVKPGNWARESIGCVRFREEFQQRVSARELEAHHYALCDRGQTGICWQHIETELKEVGSNHGFKVHNHWPGVRHWTLYNGPDDCEAGKLKRMSLSDVKLHRASVVDDAVVKLQQALDIDKGLGHIRDALINAYEYGIRDAYAIMAVNVTPDVGESVAKRTS